MYTLGHKTEMVPIKADGLRYHAAAPLVSALRHNNIVKAVAYPANAKAIFEAAKTFVQTEAWLIAPESSYAVRAGIDEALKSGKGRKRKSNMHEHKRTWLS